MEELEIRKEIVARPYQLRLLEHAIAHNSIIYLPTGSGKTYIAILLIRHFSKDLAKPIQEGGKRCAFISNTVELSRQNVREIANTTNFQVGLFVGDLNVDNWGDDKWKEEINNNQIMVGTSQVFVDMITHKHISITDFSCIVIDECHHATKSHPMHQLLSFSMYADQTRLPRVVGLTGVLLKSTKKGDILKPLIDLEAVFRGKIITVLNFDELHNVMIYSTSPKEQLLKYTGDGVIFDVENQINSIIAQCIIQLESYNLGDSSHVTSKSQRLQEPSKIKQIKSMFCDFQHQMNDMGLYPASVGILGLIIQFEINKRNSETIALRNMYRYVITKCEHIRHILDKKIKSYFSDDDEDDDIDEADVILNFSKPKLQGLLGFFAKEFSSKKPTDINCLIFVQRRFTAKCLCYVIKNFVSVYKGLSHIIPEFMVGRSTGMHYALDTLLDSKWNRQAVQRFHRKECNIIVCSSVLEEGIDIQACNYVISFDPIKQFSSYVQMKGRARSRESMYIVLCEKREEQEVTQKIEHYKKIDSLLKNYLITRTIDREIPDISQTIEQFSTIIKPFVVESGAILQPQSALLLLNRYCSSLPVDAFTRAVPVWENLSQQNDLFRFSLQLPPQSTVKDVIYSDSMTSIRWAKISAAFKACVALYKNGELNANLHPVTRKQIIENVSNIYFAKWKNENDDDSNTAGTKKNHRTYNKNYPEELTGAIPELNKICYAYYIVIEPDFDLNEENAHIIEMLNSNSNYAIVLKDKLPNLAAMPLFMSQGLVNVKIISKPIELVIGNEEELTKLKRFTKMLFTDIRNYWQKFLAISNQNGRNSFLIAPIKCNSAIDWEIVYRFQKINPLRATPMTERSRKTTYSPEDYLGKVVNVWYAMDEDVRFVVTKIRHDLSPLSSFPDDKYKNFAEFVESKYGEKVMNEKQFLIEVKGLTSRSNFFVNAAGKSSENKRAKAMEIIFIPEMCHNFHFPGDLWLKSLFLPCILHRLHYLLNAEKLRVNINRYLGIPSNSNYNPSPIKIDYSLRRVRAEDKLNEHRSMLPALGTAQRDSSINQIHTLVNVDEGNWKAYMEPTDLIRKFNTVYPIEIDYYYQFVNGLLTDMERLDLNDPNVVQVSTHNLEANKPKSNFAIDTLVKQLTNTSLNSGRTIDLLDICWITNIRTAEQYEFLAAITTASTNDVFDMERYEVLGDSFLKFSVSLLLMHRHKNWNEGFLTAVKSRMVSNRNLLYCMRTKFDRSFICSSSFEPKSEWLPPMAAIPTNILEAIDSEIISPISLYELNLTEEEINFGMCSVETVQKAISSNQLADTSTDCLNEFLYKQSIADKVVADCLESLLGVCVKNYGVLKSFEMLHYFGIFNDDEKKLLPILLNTNLITPLLKTNIKPSEVDDYLINYEFLETNLKYKFKDRAYLLQAVTHPSFPTNKLTGCYQQLEFIGDAVLDFLVSCYIFEKCQHMNPGEITDLRSALVNNVTLACICVRNHFHQYMLYESPSLSNSIRNFVEFQKSQEHKITDQVKILLEETVSTKAFNMAENVDVPKALGDILEAIIGAVFLDSGNDLRCTWQVISHLIDYELTEFIANVPIDPIRQLYEYRGADPKFEINLIETDVVMMKCTFYCRDFVKTVIGCGGNKSMAKKAAAKMALQILQKN